MFRLKFVFALVAISSVAAEDCFDYKAEVVDGMTLKEVQEKCVEKTKDDPEPKKYADCVECTSKMIDSVKKTVDFTRVTEMINKFVVKEENKSALLKRVDECKKEFNAEEKFEDYLTCWREGLVKVCESDPGINPPPAAAS